jgi:hypothetical protein
MRHSGIAAVENIEAGGKPNNFVKFVVELERWGRLTAG